MPAKSFNSLQYLIDAVSESVKINIPDLQAGYFPKDNTNAVVSFKGKSSVVFAFQLQKKLKAIKIWSAPVNEQLRNRYSIIAQQLNNKGLKCFTSVSYLNEAIMLNDTSYDVLLMDWVGRQNVKEYIISNIGRKEKIEALAKKILCLHRNLNEAGISHGHLHTGNIYIDAQEELKVIDYDSIFIKDWIGEKEYIQVYPDYNHPANSLQIKVDLKADYFAALILCLGTKAIAQDAILWGRYKVGLQENFLFSADDFLDLKNSSVYKYLKKLQSPEIDQLLEILVIYCQETDPERLQPFYTYLEKKSQPVVKLVAETALRQIQNKRSAILVTPADDMHIQEPITIPAKNISEDKITETVISKQAPVIKTVYDDNVAAISPAHLLPGILKKENNDNENDQPVADVTTVTGLFQDGNKEKIILSRPKEKLSVKRRNYTSTAKRQKSKFLIATTVLGFFILATSYFLGGLADNINNTKSKPEEQANFRQEKIAQKKISSITTAQADIKKNKHIDDTSVAKIHHEQTQTEKIINKDSLPNTQLLHTDLVVKNSAQKPVQASLENSTSANNEKDLKDSVSSPVNTEVSMVKKQQTASFNIGSPPKQ